MDNVMFTCQLHTVQYRACIWDTACVSFCPTHVRLEQKNANMSCFLECNDKGIFNYIF